MPKIKLTVELIPKTCHYSNVRTTVKPSEWNKIRFLAYAAAGNKCQICAQNGLDQGYKHRVECHEIWSYDEVNKIQVLTGLIALCPNCHLTKHFGRASAINKQAVVFNQLEIVNDWDHKDCLNHIVESFELYKERSKHRWKLDLSLLTQPPYNLKIKLPSTRKFKKPKFKRKKR
jgi:hypothetical protein